MLGAHTHTHADLSKTHEHGPSNMHTDHTSNTKLTSTQPIRSSRFETSDFPSHVPLGEGERKLCLGTPKYDCIVWSWSMAYTISIEDDHLSALDPQSVLHSLLSRDYCTARIQKKTTLACFVPSFLSSPQVRVCVMICARAYHFNFRSFIGPTAK